ncbi:MAG: type II secretion system protein [Ignavibacterium sp.]|nr:type II secretion system protein [Ignavibacterium sp.]
MKVLKNNKGFTLIETLVSINLSFIGISLIFSFYVFTQKFSESLSRIYTDKYIQMSFIHNLEKTLNNSDKYFIIIFDDRIIINTSNYDSIFISQDSISLNGILEITNIENINFSISTDMGKYVVTWSDGVLTDPTALINEDNILESNLIHSILFEFERNKRIYEYHIFSPYTSISHFNNVSKKELSNNTVCKASEK